MLKTRLVLPGATLAICAAVWLAGCDSSAPAGPSGSGAAGGYPGSGGVHTGDGAGGNAGAPADASVDAGPADNDARMGSGGARATDASPGLPDAATDTRSGTGGRADAGSDARSGAGGTSGPLPPVTVYIAGDSTVMTYPPTAANMQAGWGQFLADDYSSQVTVSNQSIGGRTSRRFIEEGRLTTILNTIRAGDYLMVQFGTNDGNTTAVYPDGEPYFVSAADFQGFMMQFIQGARGKNAIPVLVTPPPRRSCTADSHTFGNGLAGYTAAMTAVAAQTGAALVDLNAKTLAYLDMIGCVASADFFLLGDGTHFQVNGARLMAGFVADGVREAGLPLAAYGK